MAGWQDFAGLNRGYVLELYDKYRRDPSSVDAETRSIFDQWTPRADDAEAPAVSGVPAAMLQKAVGAVNLAQSIRRYGHLAAQLDPLGARPLGDPALLWRAATQLGIPGAAADTVELGLEQAGFAGRCAVVQHQLGARAVQASADRGTDPLRAAGDQHDLVLHSALLERVRRDSLH